MHLTASYPTLGEGKTGGPDALGGAPAPPTLLDPPFPPSLSPPPPPPAATYPITVGEGGNHGAPAGQSTTFNSLTAAGGAYGSSKNGGNAGVNQAHPGGIDQTTPDSGVGYPGGTSHPTYASGGGGASAVGVDGNTPPVLLEMVEMVLDIQFIWVMNLELKFIMPVAVVVVTQGLHLLKQLADKVVVEKEDYSE